MIRLITTAVLASLMAFSVAAADAPAPVATLGSIQGNVVVNQGKEFLPAQAGMRLKPGDRVLVQDQSSASIQFDDNCRVDVDANKLVTIPGRSTCAGDRMVVQSLNPNSGTAIGAVSAGGNNAGVLTLAGLTLALDAYLISESPHETISP